MRANCMPGKTQKWISEAGGGMMIQRRDPMVPFNQLKTAAISQRMIDEKCALPMEFDDGGLWHDWLAARILLREAIAR